MASERSGIPRETTSFVGREREIDDLRETLKASRIVTLIGVGGTGKTRLAIEFAARESDGVKAVFIDLAPLSQGATVPQAFVDAVGIKPRAGSSPEEDLVEGLKPRDSFLIVDNCEHVLGATAKLIMRLVAECPKLRVLATSREPLRANGEVTVMVPSLSVPAEGDVDHYAEYPAVRLFLDRARLHEPSFQIDDENAVAESAICRRLDGIPFAIELAAARLKSMSPAQIHLWLNEKFKLLTGGSLTSVKRHQTLRSLLDWSYDLLDDNEKTVLNAVSCFRGGWTLPLAAEVCTVGGIDPADVLDLHSSLVERSFVIAESRGGEPSYRMLETVREYAADRLLESGEAGAIRDLHAKALLKLAESTKAELRGPGRDAAIHTLDHNLDNFRAALTWVSSDPEHEETAMRLCAALWLYWSVGGRLSEGRSWISEVLDTSPRGLSFAIVAEVYNGASILALQQGDFDRARARAQMAVDLFRKTPDRIGLAYALNSLANVLAARGQNAEAEKVFKQSLEIRREEGDEHGVASSLNNLGALALEAGDAPIAEEFFMESATIYEKIGDIDSLALTLKNAGSSAFQQGDLNKARALFEQSVDLVHKAGNRPRVAAFQAHVAMAAAQQDDLAYARQLFEFALKERIEFGDIRGQVDSSTDLAYMSLLEGDYAVAKEGLQSALQKRLEMKDPWGEAATKYYLGLACILLGDLLAAREVLTEIRQSREDRGDKRGLAYCELWIGRIDLLEGSKREAARRVSAALELFVMIQDRLGVAKAFEIVAVLKTDPLHDCGEFIGMAESLRSMLGARRHGYEQSLLDATITGLRGAMGPDVYEGALRDGSRMGFDHAIKCAQDSLRRIAADEGRRNVD
ncbi:MAG TPA: tetratricopeptide repeat protein [Fimbriimonadaceae bacterium]|nr:tetratricopeptide repeat protein [Fimbriimonadaceae bacterium]